MGGDLLDEEPVAEQGLFLRGRCSHAVLLESVVPGTGGVAEATLTFQAGSIRTAPRKKHTAPSNVPPTASGTSTRPPVLGSTKLPRAEGMKKTEAATVIHAITHAHVRAGPPGRERTASSAPTLGARKSVEPYMSGRHTCR